jgi:hypothetical protein
MSTQISEVGLSAFSGHSGGWAKEMIARYLHSSNSEDLTARGRPKAIDSDKKKNFRQLCSVRQSEKKPVTVQEVINFTHDNRV